MRNLPVHHTEMATGGRVVHHLSAFAPDPRNAIVFAGYPAMGTRGSAMLGGAKQIRVPGEWVPVRAEVANIEGLSAHADRDELLAWLDALPAAPRRVHVTHGEPEAADSLRQAIVEKHGWACSVPEYRESIDISERRRPTPSFKGAFTGTCNLDASRGGSTWRPGARRARDRCLLGDPCRPRVRRSLQRRFA